ncbi:hypothetical protein QQ045_017674 [Rhodiola kirilowii]
MASIWPSLWSSASSERYSAFTNRLAPRHEDDRKASYTHIEISGRVEIMRESGSFNIARQVYWAIQYGETSNRAPRFALTKFENDT